MARGLPKVDRKVPEKSSRGGPPIQTTVVLPGYSPPNLGAVAAVEVPAGTAGAAGAAVEVPVPPGEGGGVFTMVQTAVDCTDNTVEGVSTKENQRIGPAI